MSRRELEAEFNAQVQDAVQQCRALGYQPKTFERMLAAHPNNAVEVARRLVTSGEIQDGPKRLKSLGRLDLSVEAIMLKEQFQELFDARVRSCAEWRLKNIP